MISKWEEAGDIAIKKLQLKLAEEKLHATLPGLEAYEEALLAFNEAAKQLNDLLDRGG